MLLKDPAARPESALAVAQVLQRIDGQTSEQVLPKVDDQTSPTASSIDIHAIAPISDPTPEGQKSWVNAIATRLMGKLRRSAEWLQRLPRPRNRV